MLMRALVKFRHYEYSATGVLPAVLYLKNVHFQLLKCILWRIWRCGGATKLMAKRETYHISWAAAGRDGPEGQHLVRNIPGAYWAKSEMTFKQQVLCCLEEFALVRISSYGLWRV